MTVLKCYHFSIRHAKAPVLCRLSGGWHGFGFPGRGSGLSKPARTGINGFVVLSMRRLQGAPDVLPGTFARINEALGLKSFESGAIQLEPLALVVWSKGAPAVGPFVPLEAEPAQVLEHGADKFGFAPGPVEVFVAKQESAALRACALLRGPKSSRVAKMKETGRGGGDSATILRWRLVAADC